jgi:hypothetical protein
MKLKIDMLSAFDHRYVIPRNVLRGSKLRFRLTLIRRSHNSPLHLRHKHTIVTTFTFWIAPDPQLHLRHSSTQSQMPDRTAISLKVGSWGRLGGSANLCRKDALNVSPWWYLAFRKSVSAACPIGINYDPPKFLSTRTSILQFTLPDVAGSDSNHSHSKG